MVSVCLCRTVSLSIILSYCSNCVVTAIYYYSGKYSSSCVIVLHYWYTARVRGLIPTSVSSPDPVSDSVIPSSFLAVLRSPRVIASSRGPWSLMPASAPLEEQEQFTVNSVQIAFWEGETLPQKCSVSKYVEVDLC